jgi:hypothetical protein
VPFDAILYDGQSGHRQQVRVDPHPDAIELTYDNGFYETVDPQLLTRLDSDDRSLRLGRSDEPGWRLVVPAEAEPEIRSLIGKPVRYGRWIDRIGLIPALVAFGAVAAGVVAVGYLAPHWLAPHVPYSWERDVGTAIVGDFGDNRCRGPGGQQVLERMVERLEPGGTRGPNAIQIAAIDYSIFNAAALPGGHIVIFDGAIQEVEDADALTGIVAHEIAHIRRRHVTEAMIREFGIGALIRLFAGDIGANAQQLVALSYTRDNESEADDDAIAALRKAGISPAPTADLFKKLASESGEGTGFNAEFLNSHPLSGARARKFAGSVDKKAHYRPALTPAEFKTLKSMCGGKK